MGTLNMKRDSIFVLAVLSNAVNFVVGQSGECTVDSDCSDKHICQDTNCVKRGVFCNIVQHCNASLVGTACLDSGLCGCQSQADCGEGNECADEICVAIDGFCRTDEECEAKDEDFECTNNACVRKPGSCAAPSDCVGNSVGYNCVSGRCGCSSANADCPAGNLYKKSKCILKGVFCSAREDCSHGSKGLGCYSGKCGCKGSADCERGGVCKSGKCKSKPNQPCDRMINASLLKMEVFALGVPVAASMTMIALILDPYAIREDVLVGMEEDQELLDQMDW